MEEIEEIEWSDELKIDNIMIDFQHELIVKRFNKLLRCWKSAADDREFIGNLLEDVISYTAYHFKSEELLMEKTNYVNTESHQEHHSKFLEICNSHKESHLDGEPLTKETFELLKFWLAGHIVEDDKEMGIWLRRFNEDVLTGYMRELEQDLNPLRRRRHSFISGMTKVKKGRVASSRILKPCFNFPILVCLSFSLILVASNLLTSVCSFLWFFVPYFPLLIIVVLTISLIIVCLISCVLDVVIKNIIVSTSSMLDKISGMDDLTKKKSAIRSISFVTRHSDVLQDSLNRLLNSMENYSKYVPLEFLQRIVRRNEIVQVGLDSRYVTIMFNDIANFTSLCEGIEPSELLEFLRHFYEINDRCVWICEGMIIAQTGDGIMAIWNAPKWCLRHEEKAIRCALMIRDEITKYSEGREMESFKDVKIRAGVHSSSCLVGNIGSDQRLSYNVFGDGVNTASRLEGANKYYHTNILISKATYLGVCEEDRRKYYFRWIDTTLVKGKKQSLELFEVEKRVDVSSLFCEDDSKSLDDSFNTVSDEVPVEETEGEEDDEELSEMLDEYVKGVYIGDSNVHIEPPTSVFEEYEKICDMSMELMKYYTEGEVEKVKEICHEILKIRVSDRPSNLILRRLNDNGVCQPCSLNVK